MSTANIKIKDPTITPLSSTSQRPDKASTTGSAGGIYYGRHLTRTGAAHRSISGSRARDSNVDVEEGGDWRRDDGRRRQVFRGKTLLW